MTFPASLTYKIPINQQGTVVNGQCVIDFSASVPEGSFYTGSVTVYDSPAGVQWNIVISGLTTDKTIGSSTCGGVQVGPGDQLQLVASGIGQYNGLTFHCTFSAISSPPDMTDLIVPGHDSIFQPFQTSLPQLWIEAINPPPLLAHGQSTNFGTPIPIIPGTMLVIGVQQNATLDVQWQFQPLDANNFPCGQTVIFTKRDAIGTSPSDTSYFTMSPLGVSLEIIAQNLDAAGSVNVYLEVWVFALPMPLNEIIVPEYFNYVVAGALANSFNTSGIFSMNSGEGILTFSGSSGGLGTSPPTGPLTCALQSYVGGGTWDTIASISASPTVLADTKIVIGTPATGRIVVTNQTAAAQNFNATFTQ